MIRRNVYPNGKLGNVLFGFCNIGDGLVRILSLGFLMSSFALEYAKSQARRKFNERT